MKETVTKLISKEEADYLRNDEKIVGYITDIMTREISDRIIQALEALEVGGEIIVKKPVQEVSEYPPTLWADHAIEPYAIEYRKTVNWEPLVRCKDCIHNGGSDNEPWCRIYECRKNKGGFCDEGERREE